MVATTHKVYYSACTIRERYTGIVAAERAWEGASNDVLIVHLSLGSTEICLMNDCESNTLSSLFLPCLSNKEDQKEEEERFDVPEVEEVVR